MKLIPSFIHPTTHFYLVANSGPDRAIELRDAQSAPMLVLDPVTDEWYGYPVGKGSYRLGPFPGQREAADSVLEVIELNGQID